MDSLEDLPEGEETQTSSEKEIMERFFDNSGNSEDKDDKKNTLLGRINWKLLGATIGAFMLVANPWIDSIIEKLPYTNTTISKFGLKTVLFAAMILIFMVFLQ